MAKIPGQRKPGQTGGGGRHGQAGNRSRSQDRGGRPHAGGGGSGKKPPGKKFCDCTMGAVIRSARQGRFRLAARYARMVPRHLARRFA